MRTCGLAVSLLALLALPALAQSDAQTAQRERMKTCNADAGEKKLSGDARKTFMADCLAGKNAAEPEKALTPQQAKMKSCNADASAKNLTGDARKTFMSSCLKG